MSSFDQGANKPRHAGFTPASTEQVSALFVTVLTLACTAISLYDLLLLASS